MDQFEKVIKEGYSFEMGKYFDEGWKLFSKNALHLIFYTLIFAIIYFIFIGIQFSFQYASYFMSFIIYPLIGGLFIYFRKQEKNEQEFGDLFSGFTFFGPIALYILVILLFMLPSMLVYLTLAFPSESISDMLGGKADFYNYYQYDIMENFGVFFLSSVIFMLVSIYIYTSYIFVIPLIVDSKLGFWQAMETSRKVVGRKFFSFLGLGIVVLLMIAFGSVFTCGLGLFVLMPFSGGILYSAYNNILQPAQDDLSIKIAEFGQSSRDINTESEDSL